MKTYCYNCGKKIDHPAQSKPNFCLHCGADMRSATGAQASPQISEEILAEEGKRTEIPQINELDFSIEMDRPRKVTVSDLAGTRESGEGVPEMERPRYENKQQALDEFKKEAGQLRKKNT